MLEPGQTLQDAIKDLRAVVMSLGITFSILTFFEFKDPETVAFLVGLPSYIILRWLQVNDLIS
ncbi:hypothetical protein OAR23_00400 [bacterium]|nr:hypothetical protein [bacterium]